MDALQITPPFEDVFRACLTENNINHLRAEVQHFSPLWSRCEELTHRLRVRGFEHVTLNFAEMHDAFELSDDALMYPAPGVDQSVWDKTKLLRVDYSKRQDGLTSLVLACYLGDLPQMRLLLQSAANVNRRLNNGNTVLMETIASTVNPHRSACVEALLSRGASVSAENEAGHTAITAAVCQADLKLLQSLLVNRPCLDLNRATKAGSTVLMLAVMQHKLDMVHYLVTQCGVDILPEDAGHLTAVCWAQSLRQRKIGAYLSLQLAVRGQLEEFIKRRERLLRKHPEDSRLFSAYFNQAVLLVMLQPSRHQLIRSGTLEMLVSHSMWSKVRLSEDSAYGQAYLKMRLWLAALSCGMLYGEKKLVQKFIQSDLTQRFLSAVNGQLTGERVDAGEGWLFAQTMLLPLAATEEGRDWLLGQVFRYEHVLGAMRHDALSQDETDIITQRTKEVCRSFSYVMDCYYRMYELRAMARLVGLADVKQVCPDPPQCVQDKVMEVMCYMLDLFSRVREQHQQLEQEEPHEQALHAIEECQDKRRRKRLGRRYNKNKKHDQLKEEALKTQHSLYKAGFASKKTAVTTVKPTAMLKHFLSLSTELNETDSLTDGMQKTDTNTHTKETFGVRSRSVLGQGPVEDKRDENSDVHACCEPQNTGSASKRSKVTTAITEYQPVKPASVWAPQEVGQDGTIFSQQHSTHFPSINKGVIPKKQLRKAQRQPPIELVGAPYCDLSQDSVDSSISTDTDESSELCVVDTMCSGNGMDIVASVPRNDNMRDRKLTQDSAASCPNFMNKMCDSKPNTKYTHPMNIESDEENMCTEDASKAQSDKPLGASSCGSSVGFYMPSVHDRFSFEPFTELGNHATGDMPLRETGNMYHSVIQEKCRSPSDQRVDQQKTVNTDNHMTSGGCRHEPKLLNVVPTLPADAMGSTLYTGPTMSATSRQTPTLDNASKWKSPSVPVPSSANLDTVPVQQLPQGLASNRMCKPPPGFKALQPDTAVCPIPWKPYSPRWVNHLRQLLQLPAQERQQVGALHFAPHKSQLLLHESDEAKTLLGVHTDGSEVAIRSVPLAQAAFINNEMSILRDPNLHNSFIINFKAYTEEPERCYLATELMEWDLPAYLHHLGGVAALPCREHTPRLVGQLLSALTALHQGGRVHTDLKPSSILVDSRGNLRLTGFKFSQLTGGTAPLTLHNRKPSQWKCKEFLEASAASQSTFTFSTQHDMQVVGMLAYYMWSGGKHFYGNNDSICQVNIRRDAPFIDRVSADDLASLLCQLVDPCVTKRISAQEALAHPFFWNAGRKLSYMVQFYKQIRGKQGKWEALCHVINRNGSSMGTNDWARKVHTELDVLKEMTASYGDNTTDLLTFMCDLQDIEREGCVHTRYGVCACRPKYVRDLLKDPATFFLCRFPRLFMVLYELGRADTSLKNAPVLEPYFLPVHPILN